MPYVTKGRDVIVRGGTLCDYLHELILSA
jgi:hypothetical protein